MTTVLTSAFDAAPIRILLTEEDGTVVYENRACGPSTGRKAIWERIPGLTRGEWEKSVVPHLRETDGDGGRRVAVADAEIARLEADGQVFAAVYLPKISGESEPGNRSQVSGVSFETMAAHIPGMLYRFVLAPDGRTSFPYCSPGCEDIWGVAPEAVREDASAIVSLIHPDDLQRFRETVMESAATLEMWEFEGRLTTAEGEEKWLHAASRPALQDSGEIHWQGLLMDITKQKETEAELEDAREKAEVAARAKSDFLARMSHEIRTPINGVMGMTELLEETDTDAKQRRYLGTIQSSAEVLLSIIDDILDFSKLEAEKVELRPVPFDLRKTIGDVCSLLSQSALKKDLEIKEEYASDIPSRLVGDPIRLHQVMVNLIGNGIKFTTEGHVLVQVIAEPSPEESVRLKIGVSDTGIGIDADAASRLFNQFVQADDSISREFGGTGLGLSICQKLVGLMGGEIEIESEPGVGSTFCFLLDFPVADPEDGSVADHSPKNEFQNPAGEISILLVEDNPVNEEVALEMLKILGYEADCAENGRVAIERVQQKTYDVVFMDCQMPIVDGFEATGAIRRLGLEKQPYIVAMTANAMDSDRRRCLEAGMDDYLPKPVSGRTIAGKLNAFLDSAVDGPDAQESGEDIFDVESALQYADRCEQTLKHRIIKWSENCEAWLENFQSACQRNDREEMGEVAYSIRGAIGYVGGAAIDRRLSSFEIALGEELSLDLPECARMLEADFATFEKVVRRAGYWTEEV